jgi:hypothetical protein
MIHSSPEEQSVNLTNRRRRGAIAYLKTLFAGYD